MHIFFFNDTATTEIYTLSLHDALPILTKTPISLNAAKSVVRNCIITSNTMSGSTPVVDLRAGLLYNTLVYGNKAEQTVGQQGGMVLNCTVVGDQTGDRKSTRLNSSHANISYAVFCL